MWYDNFVLLKKMCLYIYKFFVNVISLGLENVWKMDVVFLKTRKGYLSKLSSNFSLSFELRK